jgi:conjugative transfer signal peptidase TraF
MSGLVAHGPTNAHARRRRIFVWIVAFLTVLTILNFVMARRVVIINTSPSVAPGLYLRCSNEPVVGTLIDFCIPPAARAYVRERTGNDGQNWYILKPIAAGPGDWVDTTGSMLVLNGRAVAPMSPNFDSAGRPLPQWRENRMLGPDEFFVFSARIPNSFDSRCYGPITRNEIASVRQPILTW